MKRVIIIIIYFVGMLLNNSLLFAFEAAPRITDKEIIESLEGIRGDIKEIRADIRRLEEGQKNLNIRIDDLRSEMNSRFGILQWMIGLFITIALVILGFVLRMQWQMQKKQAEMETSLETQKDELTFIKGLIEKLLPPKGAL